MARLDYFIVENERTARRFLESGRHRQADRRPADSRVERAHDAGTGSGIAGSRTRRRRCGRTVGGGSAGRGRSGSRPDGAGPPARNPRNAAGRPVVDPARADGFGPQRAVVRIQRLSACQAPRAGQAIRRLEQRARTEGQSQLFIETPYRNLKLFDELTSLCADDTLLTVAADILQPDELIRTAPVRQWRGHAPDIHKRPAIFIVGTQAPPEKRGIGAPDRKERSARRRSR